MSLDYNNKSVPNLNFNPSGSANPIIQGTFQSSPSISNGWQNSVTTALEPGFSPSFYSYGSQHTYLQLNLGQPWQDNDGALGKINGITGIYIQGTLQKVSNGSTQNTISFEHFGNPYLPYISNFSNWPFEGNLPGDLWAQWTTEFVIKSRTWDYIQQGSQYTINDQLFGLPWDGAMTNYNQTEGGLVYKSRTSPYNAFPIFFSQANSPVSTDQDMLLNCQIIFGATNSNTVSGWIVKGTYLLL